MSATITPLKVERLHTYWRFIERGLNDILRKNSPDRLISNTKVRWQPPDVYAALQFRAATAYLVSRNRRLLGFFVVHPQNISWTDKTELFLWAAWAIPIRERRSADDVAGAIADSIAFLDGLKQTGKHAELTMITMRPGFLRRSPYREWFKPQFQSYFLVTHP